MLFSSKTWEIIMLIFLGLILIIYACVSIYILRFNKHEELKDDYVSELQKVKNEIIEEINNGNYR